MRIDPRSPVPIYAQLMELLKRDIARGQYQPGDLLPSVRALATELAINPNTVMHTYQRLEMKGIITTRRGKGIFLTPGAPALCRKEIGVAGLQTLGQTVGELMQRGMSETEIMMTVKKALRTGRQRARESDDDERDIG